MRPLSRLAGRKSFLPPADTWYPGDALSLPLFTASTPDREKIDNDFEAYVRDAYQASGVVFSTALSRMSLFAQARFQWIEYVKGRPKPLFGTDELSLLERPWPNGSTLDLLARMEQDVTTAGNSFWTVADDDGRLGNAATGSGRRLVRMRPDWVTIVRASRSGDPRALDTRVIGYEYQPPTYANRRPDKVLLLPEEVTHYAPLPDPLAGWRGMSWITPIIREVMADKAATRHKNKFFENGATIQYVARLDKSVDPEKFEKFVRKFREQHEGVDNSYKTLFLGGGADLTPVMANMLQTDFKNIQGAGETRIAAAAGMHPVVVGLSEGMAGSSLNAGNFKAAIRLTADKTMRYLWANAAASLESLVKPPRDGVRLTYDDRDISFLREDSTDVAAIQTKQASTAKMLTDAGFVPGSIVEFLETGDLQKLTHSGLFSVQLQKPGTPGPAAGPVVPNVQPVIEPPQGESGDE
jgi:phage portal protein BeeE